MTLPEWLGLASACLGTVAGAYKVTAGKVEQAVGKPAPGDDTLRDLLMKMQGTLEANRDASREEMQKIESRLSLIELRVFTPPSFMSVRKKNDGS